MFYGSDILHDFSISRFLNSILLLFWVILEFFDFLEPDFHGLILSKIDNKSLELVIQQHKIVLLCKPYEMYDY